MRTDLQPALARTEPFAARPAGRSQLFGREHELRAALDLLGGPGARALILAGEPGIGKTTIWRELLRRAREDGFEVLRAMPSGAEVKLTFAALGDLVDGLGDQALGRLPTPLRQALEVALLRAEGSTLDGRAIGVALLELLRARAAERPLLIGIDDVQWLDGPSARALYFALRRLDDARVAVVATWRTGQSEDAAVLDLSGAVGAHNFARLEVGPLTQAAIHELLLDRTGIEFPRRTLVSLFEAAHGNPLIALELAQELERRGAELATGDLPPVPASVRHLVAAHVERLAPEVRELLLAAGALARPTLEQLGRLRPDADTMLRSAIEAGVIQPRARNGEIRFSHPLLARVPYEALEPARRRGLHARLSGIVDDVEEQARHMALSAARPSRRAAEALDRATRAAGARGALIRASELSLLAARLTPAADGPRRCARTMTAARWLHRAGDTEHVEALAEEVLAVPVAAGDTRAAAMSVLAAVRSETVGVAEALQLYELAWREPQALARTRAEIHRQIAWLHLGSGNPSAARRHARVALRLAAGRDSGVEAAAAAVAALAQVMGGGGIDEDLLARAEAPSSVDTARLDQCSENAPEIVSAVTLLCGGELERARPVFEAALKTATDCDEPVLVMHALAYLSSIEVGLGEAGVALAHARRFLALADAAGQAAQRGAALWPVAVASAWLGDEAQAREAAEQGLALARGSGYGLYELGCLSALGVLELSLERPAAAAAVLWRARELANLRGVRAPGRVPLLPDCVEALVLSGQADAAAEVADELDERAGGLGAPWALALSHRCRGLLADARGDLELALTSFGLALEEHARQERPLERARTELALGRLLRRSRRKRAAREALESAARTFEAKGAALWARCARRELARIGGRAASTGSELSATEAAIAELVAAGQSNQEVAQALHLSPRTVEWNLSKVYRKLGLRRRAELATALRPGSDGKPGVSPG